MALSPVPLHSRRPAIYSRQYSFTDWEANHPLDPVPGTQLDAEFNLVQVSILETQARLALIQKDDGTIAPGVVTWSSLAPDAQLIVGAGFVARGDWVGMTEYHAGDAVAADGVVYVALEDHLSSGTFTTDLSAGLWMAFLASIRASAIPITPIVGLPGTSVQTALQGLKTQLDALATRVAALEAAP